MLHDVTDFTYPQGTSDYFSFTDNLEFVIMKYNHFVMYYYDLISLMYISMPKLAIACADNNEIVQVDIYGWSKNLSFSTTGFTR